MSGHASDSKIVLKKFRFVLKKKSWQKLSEKRNMLHLFTLTLTSGCWCDPVGSVPARTDGEAPWCHPRSGQCHCKPGVGGTSCEHCLPGHWGFGRQGCRPCTCPLTCDPVTGHCLERSDLESIFSSFFIIIALSNSWSPFHKTMYVIIILKWLMSHFFHGEHKCVCGLFFFF